MSSSVIDYPHPVLSEDTNDFIDCSFSIEIAKWEDDKNDIVLEVSYLLDSPGIQRLIDEGKAEAILRITCSRTSYRRAHKLNNSESTTVSIPKEMVFDEIIIQGIVVARTEISGYSLEEFNRNYFGGMAYKLRKGDMMALEPGMRVKLRSQLEKNPAGVILVTEDKATNIARAYFPRTDETNTSLADYITVYLPTEAYLEYTKLRTKKYYKHGIERFLQCAVVLPVLVEAISLLKAEELVGEFDEESTYRDTLWADAVYGALERIGITSLDDGFDSHLDSFQLANRILGNIESDAMSNLKRKMDDWSTMGMEIEDI